MEDKITINDIARICGVSKATVSYVLNGKTTSMKISGATYREVIDTCTRLGYKPDKTAQALSALRKIPLQIVLLTPWLYAPHSDFMAQIHNAFQRISMEEEIRLTYAHFDTLEDHLTPARYKKYDCVVIAGTSPDDDAFLRTHGSRYPNVVVLNRCVEGVCSVSGNDYEAFSQLARSVVRARHYDSFVVLTDSTASYCRQARMVALQAALPENTRTVPLESPIDRQSALGLYREYQQGKTCFVFLEYSNASLFMVHLLREGIQIPTKCGIFCYDNHTLLETYLPLQMTTVDPRLEEMVRAVHAAAKEMKLGKLPASRRISSTVCPGETAVTHTE